MKGGYNLQLSSPDPTGVFGCILHISASASGTKQVVQVIEKV